MTTLTEFLAARLDEDETAARAAIDPERPGTRWQWVNDETDEPIGELDEETAISGLSLRTVEQFASDLPTAWVGDGLLPAFVIHTVEEVIPGAGDHIARHDPARVFREVQAKRRIIARHEKAKQEARNPVSAANRQAARVAEGELEDVLKDLAAVYSDHPDYRKEWAA